jgi:REP element-mobilizing transposase RayT
VTPPRYSEKGQTCFVTVQAVGQEFRFAPNEKVRASIDFLFALLATECGLLVHEFLFMSNHFHMVVTDPDRRLSEFLQTFDSMLSRQLNALRGGSGSNFEKRPGIQIVADAGGILKQAVYTLSNPLASHLVELMREWKASSSWGMEYGQAVTFARPDCGLWTPTRARVRKGQHPSAGRLRYRGRSNAPETATLTLARPKALRPELSDAELRALVRAEVRARETELLAQRKKARTSVVGWVAVVARHFRDVPTTSRVLFQRKPRVTGTDASACARVLATIDRFVKAYRAALEDFKAGKWPTFPHGTLQMVDRFNVPCATAPP